MTTMLDRITGTLYRVGGHSDDGSASVASLAVGPVRMVAGELAASMADTLTTGRQDRSVGSSRRASADIGPSIP